MAEIPSQISFEHMLAHMFPGFFSALTVFMIFDILSPSNITELILRDFNAMVVFFGYIFLVGTILGVIIDGFHHKYIELGYFSSLERDMDAEGKKKRLGIKKKGVEIDDDDDFVHVSTSKIADHICNLMGCFKGKGYKCGNCDFYKRHRYELLKLYYAFDINNVDKCIALYDYLKKSVYFYYEFYANTFIAMIPFTFVAPLYMVKRLNLDFSNAAYIGIALIVLTIVCLDFAWMAYERWISVLYFAFCRCFEGKTLGEKEEHSVEINWD